MDGQVLAMVTMNVVSTLAYEEVVLATIRNQELSQVGQSF